MNLTKLVICAVCLSMASACMVYYPVIAPSHAQSSQYGQSGEQNWQPTNLAEAIAACEKVHGAEQIPIFCKFDYITGRPTMLIGFSKLQTAKAYIEPMVELVATPFCSSANKANRQAYLLFVVNSVFAGNMYSCETKQASGWFGLEKLYEFYPSDHTVIYEVLINTPKFPFSPWLKKG